MNQQLIYVIASILVALFECYQVDCHPRSGRIQPINPWDTRGIANSHWSWQLPKLLGRYLMLPEQVLNYLAATHDKDKSEAILNKYSVNDLLAVKDVQDFSPEKFNQKLALCESLKPDAASVKSSRSNLCVGRGEPCEFVLRKNLHNYCEKAFDNYHYDLKSNMKVSQELDKGMMQLDSDVWKFCMANKYGPVYLGQIAHAKRVMAAFLAERRPVEVARIKKMCSDFYGEVKFAAERALYGFQTVPFRYERAYFDCQSMPQD